MKRYVVAVLSVAAMIVAAGLPLASPAGAASARQASSIQILAPAANAVVTGDTVVVKIAIKNFTMNCAWAGKPPRAGIGHWHLLLDGGLVNMECGTAAVLSMQNVTPGKHTIVAMLAANDHSAIAGKAAMATTTITYKPAHALPALAAYTAPGKPSITIAAPNNNAVVGEHFKVVLNWANVRLSCALLGKANVAGYGHWHLFVDSLKKGLATMLDMGCSHGYTAFTDGLTPGKHTLYAVLADNLHAPIAGAAMASITINVQAAGSLGAVSALTQRWMKWDAGSHTATLTLTANYDNTQSGFNFNGYGNGKMVISVPVGAHVRVTFSNKGSLPHSAVITPENSRTSTSGFPDAFQGSGSPNPTSGMAAGTTQHFSFVANKTGTYALVCAVPGHEAAGMWDVFTVTSGGQPSIRAH
ncbi:MAG: sulfocyanin-like copper-binding protein [Chloroflexota bacterium]